MEKHGILLTTEEIRKQYQRYNGRSKRRHAARIGVDPGLHRSFSTDETVGKGANAKPQAAFQSPIPNGLVEQLTL